jgi:hypothetical protein
MRSVHELPGEPWPHDIVISVDQPNNLLTLLFVREVWDIARDVDIPELAPPPAPGNSMRPESPSPEVWSERWVETWNAVWAWYVDGGGVHYRDAARIDPQAALAELAANLPPMWERRFGSEGIDHDALWQWMQTLHDAPRPCTMRPDHSRRHPNEEVSPISSPRGATASTPSSFFLTASTSPEGSRPGTSSFHRRPAMTRPCTDRRFDAR